MANAGDFRPAQTKKIKNASSLPDSPPPRHPSNTDISNNVGSCQDCFGIGWFSLFLFWAYSSRHSEEWSSLFFSVLTSTTTARS